MVAFEPRSGATVSTDLRELRIQFNEGIDLSNIAEIEARGVEICEQRKDGGECDVVHSVDAAEKLLVLQTKTKWPKDTLVIELLPSEEGAECVLSKPHTTYQVHLPQAVFRDSAGNSFVGIQGDDASFEFIITC